MPKYRVLSDMARISINPPKEKIHPELLSKTVKMMIVDKPGAIVSGSAKAHQRRQRAIEVAIKTTSNDELRRKVIQIEQVYREICESESNDIELITAGLARFKR